MTGTPPQGADALIQVVIANARAKRFGDAFATIDHALAEPDGGSDAMLSLAGLVAGHANDPARAESYLTRLHRRRPDDRATRLALAQAMIAQDRFGEAIDLCAPLAGDAAADRMRAYALHRIGDVATAVPLYRAVLQTSTYPDDWANFGNALAAAGDLSAAVDAFEHAITRRPDDVRFYLNLAQVLERSDRRAERLNVMRDAARICPDDADVQVALGLAHVAMEERPAAEAALRRAIALAPDKAAAYLELGLLLENQNRIADLKALVASARPYLGSELALLDAWIAFRSGEIDEAARMAAVIPETIQPLRRFHLQGQIADRREDAVVAFRHFGEMNVAALAISPTPSTNGSYRDDVIAATERFAARSTASNAGAHHSDSQTPTFIVGFPRSGTTLLDTILGRLPGALVLEEQPILPTIESQIRSSGLGETISDEQATAYRKMYHDQVSRIAPGAIVGRIIDKHPLHMARMPLLDRLFPAAPILLVERHPCDVVLSCFTANFQLNRAMRSFTDLTEAALTYDAVWSAWHMAEERLPLRVHRVRYERLVASPESELRAALKFLGAPFSSDLLDTVTAARERAPVRTASYSQVTEAIYDRSVERWRRYRDQLSPVLHILDPWIRKLNYQS